MPDEFDRFNRYEDEPPRESTGIVKITAVVAVVAVVLVAAPILLVLLF